jgi:hypothetical protein
MIKLQSMQERMNVFDEREEGMYSKSEQRREAKWREERREEVRNSRRLASRYILNVRPG